MKTITFNLQKGGVGKTSMSLAAAYELSNYGKTCIVDLDPQGNASDFILNDKQPEIADGFIMGVDIHEIIKKTSKDNLYIVPSSSKLATITNKLDPDLLNSLLQDLKKIGFKYVIIDTPPAVEEFPRNILKVCNEVITPLVCDYFSISGVTIFNKSLQEVRETNTGITYNKIILNKIDRRIKTTKQMIEQIKAAFPDFTFYEIGTSQEFTNRQFTHEFVNNSKALPKPILQEIKRLAEDIK